MTSEEIKTAELTDEALRAISGGAQQNRENYTFHDQDTLIQSPMTYIVKGDHVNVDAETPIMTTARNTLRQEEYEQSFKASYLYTMWRYRADPGSTVIS